MRTTARCGVSLLASEGASGRQGTHRACGIDCAGREDGAADAQWGEPFPAIRVRIGSGYRSILEVCYLSPNRRLARSYDGVVAHDSAQPAI